MKLLLDNGKEIELSEELANQLQEVINEEKKQNGWNRVTEQKRYYFNSLLNVTTYNYENNDNTDKELYNVANYFSSKELAEKIAFKQILERKLMRFSAEHKGDKIDLKDANKQKYYIYYNYKTNELKICDFNSCCNFGGVYFYSKEIAKQAVEEFKDDLIKYFTMDIYHNEDQTTSEE